MSRLSNGRFAAGNQSFYNVRGRNGKFLKAGELAEALTSSKPVKPATPAVKPLTRVLLLADVSGSMDYLMGSLRKYVGEQSKKVFEVTEPDTVRLSVYAFDDHINKIVTDATTTPTYVPLNGGGMTAFIDAVMVGINDLSGGNPDDARLVIVITDGCENSSYKWSADSLRKTIQEKISTDKWTFVALTPEAYKSEPEKFGFLPGCVKVWDVSQRGLENVSRVVTASLSSYNSLRSQGVTSTKSFFEADVNSRAASRLNDLTSNFNVFTANSSDSIKTQVEKATGRPYRVGSTYYKLNKAEAVQPYKNILLRKGGRVYGGDGARQAIGLPDHEVRVAPGKTNGYDVFVLSTSVNRNIFSGTEFLVEKQ